MSESNKNWQHICGVADLVEDSGVCALIHENAPQEQQIALFYLDDENAEKQVFAVGNYDPFGQANVLYRGLLGCAAGEVFVASPLYKQRFALSDGRCLDDSSVSVPTFSARVNGNNVEVLL